VCNVAYYNNWGQSRGKHRGGKKSVKSTAAAKAAVKVKVHHQQKTEIIPGFITFVTTTYQKGPLSVPTPPFSPAVSKTRTRGR